jgi:copper chaperone CopZ
MLLTGRSGKRLPDGVVMMNNSARIALALTAAVVLACVTAGCKKAEQHPASDMPAASKPAPDTGDQPLVAEPGTTVLSVAVEGMHCDSCAATVCKKVRQLDGVRKARVSFSKKTAWVMVEEGKGPDLEGLIEVVKATGYKAKPAVTPTTQPASQPA